MGGNPESSMLLSLSHAEPGPSLRQASPAQQKHAKKSHTCQPAATVGRAVCAFHLHDTRRRGSESLIVSAD